MARNPIVRNAARAVILDNGRLLTVKMRDSEGPFYLLPGGGQRMGETLPETLKRECMEEIAVDVDVGELLFVREYIGRNHIFKSRHANFHQLECVFRCTVADPDACCVGEGCDNRQVGIHWAPLEDLPRMRFFPKAIIPFFAEGDIRPAKGYLGDVN